jgi:hypothetical protein
VVKGRPGVPEVPAGGLAAAALDGTRAQRFGIAVSLEGEAGQPTRCRGQEQFPERAVDLRDRCFRWAQSVSGGP